MFSSWLNQGGAAMALLALSAAAWSAGPLTLEQAQRIAEQRSQAMVALQAGATAAREMGVAAGQLPDPVLKLGLENIPVNGAERFTLTREFMTMARIGFMQELTHAEKRRARTARYESEAEAVSAGRALALAELRLGTAKAWLERHYQERMLEALQLQRAEANLQVQAADASYRGGRGIQADLFATRSALALIDDRIEVVRAQIAMATTRLTRWIGAEATQALATAPALDTLGVDTVTLEIRIAAHPQMALLAKQEDAARADAQVAQSDKLADWSVELMYSQRGSAFSNMVSLNFSRPLQWDQKNRQDRGIAAKLAQVDQISAQREELTRERLAEIRAWLQEWHSNRARLARYEATLVPLASERTRAALAAYRGGAGPLAAVLEARRMEIDVRIERLRLEMETAALWAQLNFSIPDGPGLALRGQASATLER